MKAERQVAAQADAAPAGFALHPWARALIILLAAVQLLYVAMLCWNRVTSRVIFDGGDSMHALFAYQSGEGMPLYGQPDIKVQELWYNPLSFQIMGLVSRPFNYDIRAMRAAMLLFGAGSIALVALLVHRLTGNKLLSFVAAAWMSAIDAGIWFIEVTPNPPHVFFALLAVYLLVRDPEAGWRTTVLATVSLFLSYWSKQTALPYVFAGVFYILTRDRRRGVAAAFLAAALIGVGTLYYASGETSSYLEKTFSHGNHPMMWEWLVQPALFPELLGRFGILCAIIAAGLFTQGWEWRKWVRPEYVFLGASAVLGLVARVKYGSGPTQAIVFYGMIIACGATFVARLAGERAISMAVLASVVCFQSVALARNINSQFITREDASRFEEILDILATPGKKTYYINSGFHNHLVGKETYAAVGRDCWYKGQYDRSRFPAYYRDLLNRDPFDLVIIDVPLEDNSWFMYERLNTAYQPVREIPAARRADTTLRMRKVVFVRKDQLPNR